VNSSGYIDKGVYQVLFGKPWPKWLGGVILALLNIGLFIYLMPLFGVYPAMADWGIWTYKLAGLDIPTPWGSTLELPHLSSRSLVNFGLLFGALIGALLSKEFLLRKASVGAYVQSTLGGALMGIGSFLVGSCIIGGFYSSVMALSLSGFYMMIGLVAGGYLGGIMLMKLKLKKTETAVFQGKTDSAAGVGSKSPLPKIGFFAVITLVVIAAAYYLTGKNLLGGVILFSIAFGLVFQRSGLGFSTAFREIFTTKNNESMRAVLISLAVGIIGFSIIKANGIKPANMFVSPAGWHTLIGGLIFGFGMVIADG
jgi:uncharacterized membrane protein YedE/YeeE